MFIDEIKIKARAGRGGDGVVRWRQEKFIDRGGPNGGDGGRGGNVYAVAVQDIHLLSKYKHKKEFEAQDGAPGEGVSKHGKTGNDLVIDFPVGSIITNKESGASVQLLKVGQKELLLKGGSGGYGNEHFKSSINTTPKTATKGKDGEEGNFKIELQLFADIGLIGLPNAGKSSLINMITNSKAKIGAYQFTTLDPNLGDFFGYVIADIPGLIEGASEGKGLGTKFLRHVKRTKVLVHLVSLENENPVATYKAIRKELKEFDESLMDKDEVILLTKTDVLDNEKKLAKVVKDFEKLEKTSRNNVSGGPVYTISLYDDASVKKFSDALIKLLREQ